MSATSSPVAPRSPQARSALSNGKRAFVAADGRSREARLLRDREHELAEPFGGLEGLATPVRLRVSVAAALSVRLEQVRSQMASGVASASDEDLVRLANGLGRELAALERLASKRKPEGGDPLADYLRDKAEREAAA